MEHSLEKYLQRLPISKLEEALLQYEDTEDNPINETIHTLILQVLEKKKSDDQSFD